MIVKPFRGLRPRAELAARVASPPYDVMSSAEARVMAADNPYSFLHVLRPEIDLDPTIDVYDDAVYARGKENFDRMLAEGWLERDERPAFYVYRLTRGDHRQTGIVAASAIDDYLEGRIKRHEFTRPDKERDRTRHMDTLSANVGPVFLAHRPVPELTALARGAADGEAEVSFEAPDGVRHELWVVQERATIQKVESLIEKISRTYIADGHHRAAASVNVARTRRENLGCATGDEPCNYFLTVLFPSDQLEILDYNRLVRDLNGLDVGSLIARIEGAGFEVRDGYHGGRPKFPETFGMYVDGSWYLLIAGPDLEAAAAGLAESLDVSLLTRTILEPILGIGDPRTDRRIEFVGGIRGTEELKRRVDEGDHAVGFSLHPTTMEQVMQVADAGEIMPPKSTWFEPKLRSGLVLMTLEGESL